MKWRRVRGEKYSVKRVCLVTAKRCRNKNKNTARCGEEQLYEATRHSRRIQKWPEGVEVSVNDSINIWTGWRARSIMDRKVYCKYEYFTF